MFYDFGITGTKAEVRDGLQALLYECRIGRIDYVLTKSVSRFARNAINDMVSNSCDYLRTLRENLKTAIHLANPDSVEYLDARMADLQRELIDRTARHENYDDLAEEILRLREVREQALMDDMDKTEHQNRIRELQEFIRSQPKRLSFNETLVKHLLSKATVFEDHLVFEFKSGVAVSVEK